jgi:hypothetical protein
MNKWFRKVVTGILLGGAVVLGGGFSLSPASADVNDFTFSSMRATYLLGVDANGYSTLTTIEKLTAVFPETDQNRGIQRAIPVDYNGHSTGLTLESVEDGEGVPLDYTAEESGGFLVVTMASDQFVHGSKTYVVTYTQHDVILTPSDGQGSQEFYWDVNGTGWAQPFDSVVAVVMMPAWLADSLSGSAACYQGAENSATSCTSLEKAPFGDTVQFTATANALAPGENLTVAVGFNPETFAQRDFRFFASPEAIPLLVVVFLGLGVVLTTLVIRRTRWRDHPGRGIIIAEYGPPPTVTPLVAATVFGRSSKVVAATVLNLAVAGNLRILDEREKKDSTVGSRARRGASAAGDFTLELVSADNVQPEEREFLVALFGQSLEVGSQHGLSAVDASVNRKIAKVRATVLRSTRTSGIRGVIGTRIPTVVIGSSALITVAGLALALSVGASGLGGSVPFLLAMVSVICLFVTIVFSVNVHPLTEEGAAMRDHLRGLREFIALAEADRLRVLQSPTGALRVPVDLTDKRLRLKLTEKVLPYAVLFGLEKEWAQELATLYAENDAQPTWFVGGPGFNALIFSAALTTFSSAVTSSWAASSSSSGAGGSGGGGFSGGGGGGGGGGGV